MAPPRVSILIPTLQGERELARLLPALAGQRIAGGFELRAVDSGSTDRTRELLLAAGAALTEIPRASFRHGPTRNLLAAEARGELLVFLSQDALPSGPDALEALTRPLDDARVAGATARILPFPEDDPLTARTVLAAPEASADARILEAPPAAGPVRFNNVASCIRRAVLEALPFPDLPFGEDSAWAERALAAGWRIAHEPRAVVHHAHRYGPRAAFERYRVDAAFLRRVYGIRVRPSLWSVARGIAFELREDARFLGRTSAGRRALARAPALRAAQVLGQYFGSRGWNPGGGEAATRKFA